MGKDELIRNSTLTIGTSAVVVSEEQYQGNAERSVILIINTSTGGQKITIAPDDEATSGIGIVLGAGGFYQDSKDSGYIPTQTRISAISDIAGGTISIHERVIVKRGF